MNKKGPATFQQCAKRPDLAGWYTGDSSGGIPPRPLCVELPARGLHQGAQTWLLLLSPVPRNTGGHMHRGQGAQPRRTDYAQEPRTIFGVLAPDSGTKVGGVSDGELDGDDDAHVMVEAVWVWAERAVSAVVVVADRKGSAATAIRVATTVVVGRGERRQRPFPDPGSP